MRLTFAELPAFTQAWHAIADDETLRAAVDVIKQHYRHENESH